MRRGVRFALGFAFIGTAVVCGFTRNWDLFCLNVWGAVWVCTWES